MKSATAKKGMTPARPHRNGALKGVLQDQRPNPDTKQRRLPKAARRDPYEMDNSPEKPMAGRKRVVMPGAEISPLKKRKAGPKRDAAAQSSVEAEESAPMNHPEESMTSTAKREALRETARGSKPKDRGPHSRGRAPEVMGSEQLEGDDATSDGLFVGQHDTEGGRKVADAESVRPLKQQVTPQRRRGRPRETHHSAEGTHVVQLEQTIAEAEPSSAKRRLPRLTIEGTHVVQLEQTIAEAEPSSAKRRLPRLTMKERLAKVSRDPTASVSPIERIGNSKVILPEESNPPVKYKLTSAAGRLKKSVEKDTLRPIGRVVKSSAACLTNIARQQQVEEAQALERQEREQRRLERQREREERRERDQYEYLRKKWGILHSERRRAAGGCLTVEKQERLQYKESEPEFDQNGNLFERVEVFRTRAPGPLPAAIAQIRAGKTFKPWSNKESRALEEGLKQWSNDEEMVFTRIIRMHCTPGGLLADRNVTEIVVAAADLKERLSRSQKQSDGRVQEWVRKIPVWTEPRSLLKPTGQENGEEEDADDSDEEEAEAEEEALGDE